MYVCTHNIADDHNDPILNALRRCQLFNNRYDRGQGMYVCTHNIADDHNDPILNALRRCQLFNNRYDRGQGIVHKSILII